MLIEDRWFWGLLCGAVAVLGGFAFSYLITGCAAVPPPPSCEPPPTNDRIAFIYATTEERFAEYVQPLPDDVRWMKVETEVVEAGGFAPGCKAKRGETIKGCSWWSTPGQRYHVQVLACRHDVEVTLAHEHTHNLLHHVFGNGDPDHERTDVWGSVAALRRIQ